MVTEKIRDKYELRILLDGSKEIRKGQMKQNHLVMSDNKKKLNQALEYSIFYTHICILENLYVMKICRPERKQYATTMRLPFQRKLTQ